METLALQTILEYSAGNLLHGKLEQVIRGLTTDSRKVKEGELFVALQGERFDGHDYVEQSARNGARGAIVKRRWATPNLPEGFTLIAVDDVLPAYQNIAAGYRKSLRLKLIAITGSNGKTSTKDLAAAVLGSRYKVMKTSGNLNNHIGVPQTLLCADINDEIAVLEMGMNHPGEIAPLAAMARPDTAIITNIGSAHLEFMKTRAAIAEEKGMLAEAVGSSGHVILPAEDDFAGPIAKRTRAQVLTVGFARGEFRAESVSEEIDGSRFQIVDGSNRAELKLPVIGSHMVLNALFAVAAGRAHGLSLDDCALGLETAQLTTGRMELKSVGGLQIIDDSYNANPDSMVAALRTLARIPSRGHRIAVLGRMGELGEFSEPGHRQVGDAVAQEKIDHLITVGIEADWIAKSATAGGIRSVITVSNVTEAAERLNSIARRDDLILIKGSRSAGMEKIIDAIAGIRGSQAVLLSL